MRITSLLAALVAVFGLSACSQSDDQATLTFTAIPDQDASQLRQRFAAVADYLEAELDIPVEYTPVKSYAAAVTAFRNDQVQLAWFGGLSGVQARRLVPGSQAIAQGHEDQFFKTYFIAHRDSELEKSEDFPEGIEGLRFTFGSKGSTSGRLMPEFYIREHSGQAPEALFDSVGFSGDHSQTISLVASGAYQAGAVNFKVWERELAAGEIDTGQVQVIWETPTYPDYQWTVRGDLDEQFGEGTREALTRALLEMDDPDLLERFPRSAFVPADNDDYSAIEDTAKAIGLFD
ncbi:MAG: putative selenate ABC transporter substrate-binding protein [Pseudomonadota bacterium]